MRAVPAKLTNSHIMDRDCAVEAVTTASMVRISPAGTSGFTPATSPEISPATRTGSAAVRNSRFIVDGIWRLRPTD